MPPQGTPSTATNVQAIFEENWRQIAIPIAPRYFTTSDGLAHAYYELADGTDGPPVILQHGFSATTMDEWVAPGIASAIGVLGRRVIGLDALGHGRSDHPHAPRHYGEPRMAADISALATHLGLTRFDLVGYSMGAIVALLVGTSEPRLRRLVVGGVGEGVIVCGGVDRRVLDTDLLAEGLRADDVSTYPRLVQDFRRGIEMRGNDRLALAAHSEARHATPIPLERIAAPTLLLAGDTDPLAAHPERLAAAIPDCRLVTVPGDHTGARLAPDFAAALVDFLR